MVYKLADHHEAVRAAVRDFGAKEIRPIAKKYDEEKRYPEDLARQAASYDFVGARIPEAYGGAGVDDISACIITEELWRADPGVGGSISARGFGSELLNDHGDEWMREEWLTRIADGDSAIATAISEPAHGSDVSSIETKAEREGDEWVINGVKTWITNGSVADVVLLLAKTDPGAGHSGISVFLIPTDTEGFNANTIDNKLGIWASNLAELVLDEVRIPADNLVGEENRGFFHLMDFFPSARINVAAQAIGVSQAALDAATGYATERQQFDQPIADFQAIRHMLAEIDTRNEAARSLTYRAAAKLGDGNQSEVTRLASMAKLFASERAVENCDDALQIFGSAGYVSDFPVERYYRDARITKIYDGTSEIQKNVIAKQIL